MGIGISFFTEGVGAGPRKHMDILGLGMADGCELRVHPTGKAQLRLSVQTQGQGHETTFAQIVSAGARPAAGGHRGHPRRHRQHAVRAGHLRLPVDAGVRCGRRHCGATDPGEGEDHRRGRARGQRRRPGVGSRPLAGARATRSRAAPSPRSPCSATATSTLPEGVEGHLDASVVYDPPNLTYPFGAYICVTDVDPGTGRRQGAPVHRGGRLRPADQPDDRRGSGPRRPRGRHRYGADAADRVRRGRQLRRRFVHGLPAADVAGVPELGARRDGHAVAAPPARPQGRRRVGDRGIPAGGGQLGDRRDLAPMVCGTRTCRSRPANVWMAMQGTPMRTDLAVT